MKGLNRAQMSIILTHDSFGSCSGSSIAVHYDPYWKTKILIALVIGIINRTWSVDNLVEYQQEICLAWKDHIQDNKPKAHIQVEESDSDRV